MEAAEPRSPLSRLDVGIILTLFFVGIAGVLGLIAVVDAGSRIGAVGKGLGIAFVIDPATRKATGIVAEKGSHADLRIRRFRDGRFQVRDRTGRRIVADGEPIVVADSVGVRHRLILHGFDTNAASPVASRR